MEYILSHKGTTENLFILADNVLSEFSIALNKSYDETRDYVISKVENINK